MAGRFSCPGLPWRSGVAAAGSQAIGSWEQLLYQGKALAVEGCTSRGAGTSNRIIMPSMCPHQSKGRKEENAGTPSTAGVDSKGGERPLLWRFFPQFLIAEKLGPAPARPQASQPENSISREDIMTVHKILCHAIFENFFQKRC